MPKAYNDPTANLAVGKVTTQEHKTAANKVIKAIFCLCDAAGFEVVERVVLRDKKTGKIWK